MSAAEPLVKKGSIIIMVSKCNNGHGGNSFFKIFRDKQHLSRMMNRFLQTHPEQTVIDQWQSQIFARISTKATVIFASDETVRSRHMTPAHSVDEALLLADELLSQKGISNGSVLVLSDGVSVIAEV